MNKNASPNALVVEGGAMRGIFASGVLDAFIEHDYRPSDFAIGVSASATTFWPISLSPRRPHSGCPVTPRWHW